MYIYIHVTNNVISITIISISLLLKQASLDFPKSCRKDMGVRLQTNK